MNREHILSVLYDLTLTIGSEVKLDALLTKVLQRFLYHTSFPAGVVVERYAEPGGKSSVRLACIVGDHVLAQQRGKALDLPCAVMEGDAELHNHWPLLARLHSGRDYHHCLKLPVDADRTILLLSMAEPESNLPLTQVFRPVLRNLAKAIELCRRSEQLTHTLIADRDQARAGRRGRRIRHVNGHAPAGMAGKIAQGFLVRGKPLEILRADRFRAAHQHVAFAFKPQKADSTGEGHGLFGRVQDLEQVPMYVAPGKAGDDLLPILDRRQEIADEQGVGMRGEIGQIGRAHV